MDAFLASPEPQICRNLREACLGRGPKIVRTVVGTEISRKFRLERVVPDLERCGFATEEVFTDARRWFALLLLRRLPHYSPQKPGR